jgi:hypothetical protein
MYFAFSMKYISAIFVRPNTLGKPPVPSLCGLFKMGLTDIHFFYISYDKDIWRNVSKGSNSRPNLGGGDIPSGSSVA